MCIPSRAARAISAGVLIAALAGADFAGATSDVVISQFYKSGGDSAATYKNDYVELFNRGASPVDVTGWSLQYRPTPILEWFKVADLSGTIEPGRYYLVQFPGGTRGDGADLPSPEALGWQGLVRYRAGSLILLTVGPNQFFCGQADLAADRVAYGASLCGEGSPIPAFTDDVAALRAAAGCMDTDDNLADFSIAAPAPRNSASPPSACIVVQGPPIASEQFGRPRPNPSAGATEVTFALAKDGPVRLAVFDLGGRHVRTLVDSWQPTGLGRAAWDGAREDGTPTPAGVYLLRFEAPGDGIRDSRRFVRVR